MDVSTLFSYDAFGFILELSLACALLVRSKPRRPRFPLRLAGSMCLTLVAAPLVIALFGDGWLNLLRYAALLGLVVAELGLCFELTGVEALFFGLAAYNIQHCGWRAAGLIGTLWPTAYGPSWEFVHRMVTCLLILTLCTAFSRALRKNREAAVNNRQLLGIVSAVLLGDLVLSYLPIQLYGRVVAGQPVENAYAILCCLLTLALQSGMLLQSKLLREQEALRTLWAMDKQQYALTKRSVDLINTRSHDLKKQISLLLASPDKSDETRSALQEVRLAIDDYDRQAKTGNPALDVLLTQKLMQADAQRTSLTYLVDGAEFARLGEVDLYAIFGNLLDNALEATAQIDDTARRVISLRAVRTRQMLVVSCENYVADGPAGGIGATTKHDRDNHGFGLRSTQMAVERHGGNLEAEAAGAVFRVRAVLPAA